MPRDAQPRYRKDRDHWFARIDGKKVKLAEGKANRKEALRVFHDLMAASGRSGPEVASVSVRKLANDFLTWVQENREPATLDFYRRHLKSFCAAHADRDADSIRPHDVDSWMAAHDWAEGNRAGAVTTVKRLYRWARKRGRLEDDPLADMEKPTPGRREVILTTEQYREIMAAIPDRPFRDLLTALWESGARPGEVMGLTADRVDLERGQWRVVNKTRRKTREKVRLIELTPRLVELSSRLLAEHPEGLLFRNTKGGPWTRHLVAHRFGRLRRRLGFGPEATAYSLRHQYITDALEQGVPIATVAELVGHKDTNMISRVYSKLSQRRRHLKDAAGKVRPDEDAR